MFLKKPKLSKTRASGKNETLNFWQSDMQGWRAHMEDTYIANHEYDVKTSLFCIFDGHGGNEVAIFCANNFPVELKKSKYYISQNYGRALHETFLKMDEMMRTKTGQTELLSYQINRNNEQVYSGCTAIVVLIVQDVLYIANAGDSRCLIFNSKGDTFIMNEEHKPYNSKERSRIYKAGGVVLNGRINEILNLSRAIGDLEYKQNFLLKPEEQSISAVPDIMIKVIAEDDLFMLIGCDGVFEKLSDIDIRNIIFNGNEKGDNMQNCLDDVLDQCLADDIFHATGGTDNMTAILIKFNQKI